MDLPRPLTALLPRSPRPIVLIGAGGIVRDAHLPAYRLAGFTVAAIHDLDFDRARRLAADFGIPTVSPTFAAAVAGAPAGAVFDIAVPASALPGVLSALPDYFTGGRVVALGEIGLHRGGEHEEEAFLEQLALAKRLKLRVLVHTPHRNKESITRRTLTLLRASGIPPSRVLVDHTNRRTVRLVLECGHYAGLTVHPEELSGERAVALVRELGTSRVVLDSDSGEGVGDILGLPRAARLLEKAKLSSAVVARVTRLNAARFYRVEL